MKLAKLRTLLDWKDWLALIIGSSITAWLGLSNITQWSIWYDEAFSEHITRHSFFDIARYTISDVHPPLYYWTLKLWCMVFGRSELALRSLSLLFLLIAIAIIYILVRRVFTRRSAIVTLSFLAISPMLFRYGVEARMYTMELCIVAAATAALVYAINHRARKAWVLYGALIGLGMLTHYFSIMVWVAQAVWLLAQNRQKTLKDTIKNTFATGYGKAVSAALIVGAVWLPFMVWQIAHIQGSGFWIAPVSFNTIPNLVSNMYSYQDSMHIQGWYMLAIAVMLAATIYSVCWACRVFTGNKKQVYSLLIASAVLPPVLLILGSMPPLRPSFVDRYVLSSITLWFVVSGIAVAQLWDLPQRLKLAKALAALTVGLLTLGCYQVYAVGNINKDNGSIHTMRRAMQIANSNAEGSEPIMADSAWRYLEASYYEQSPHTVYFRSEDNTKDGSYAMLRDETANKILVMSDFAKAHPIVWFLTSQSRDSTSQVPRGWREVETHMVDDPSELRVVKMEYVGVGA